MIVYLFARLPVGSFFVCSLVRWFTCLFTVRSIACLCDHLSIWSCLGSMGDSFVRLCICALVRLSGCSLDRLPICLCARLAVNTSVSLSDFLACSSDRLYIRSILPVVDCPFVPLFACPFARLFV